MSDQIEYRYNRLTWPEMNEAIGAAAGSDPTDGLDRAARPSSADRRRSAAGGNDQPRGRQALQRRGAGAAGDSLWPEPAPHRFPRHDPHRAGGLHRLLPECHQERRLPRLREDPDRQRPRLQPAADRHHRPPHHAGDRLALRRLPLHPPRGRALPRDHGVAGHRSRRRVRDLALPPHRPGAGADGQGRRRTTT